jgi:hypothetical protein
MKHGKVLLFEDSKPHHYLVQTELEGSRHTLEGIADTMIEVKRWLGRLAEDHSLAHALLVDGHLSMGVNNATDGLKIVDEMRRLHLPVHAIDFSTDGLHLPEIDGINVNMTKWHIDRLVGILDALPEPEEYWSSVLQQSDDGQPRRYA